MITKWGWKNFHLKVKMKGGGGGGGGAGIVGYPEYLEDWHCDLAKHCGASRIAISMTDVMNAALGNDPYTGEIAYNPDADITAYEAAIAAFAALLAGINEPVDWAVLFTQAETSIGAPTPVTTAPDVGAIGDIAVGDAVVGDIVAVPDIVIPNIVIPDITVLDIAVGNIVIPNITVPDITVSDIIDTIDVDGISEAEIIADIAAFADQLDDEINTKVLPRFESGMLDINAVASSAYAIGRSTVEGFRNREVAKYASTLRLAAEYKNADMELDNVKLHLDVRKINVNKTLEVERANLIKDVEIGKANINKDIEVGRANITKDVEIGKSNIGKNISIEGSNLNKDVEVGKINISKDVDIEKTDTDKDVEIGRVNVTKNIEIEKTNTSKDIDVGRINLNKDVSLEQMSTEIKKFNANTALNNAKAIIAFHSMYIEGSSQILNFLLSKYAWEESYMKVVIEGKRIKIVAKKEEADMNLDIDESAATWDLNVFQHGANLLASIGGGVYMPNERKKNAMGSTLGGALSGAAAGAMYGTTKGAVVGSGWGAVIGAVLGAAVGYLSA